MRLARSRARLWAAGRQRERHSGRSRRHVMGRHIARVMAARAWDIRRVHFSYRWVRKKTRHPRLRNSFRDSANRIWVGTRAHGAFLIEAGNAPRAVRKPGPLDVGKRSCDVDHRRHFRVRYGSPPMEGESWWLTRRAALRIASATTRTRP